MNVATNDERSAEENRGGVRRGVVPCVERFDFAWVAAAVSFTAWLIVQWHPSGKGRLDFRVYWGALQSSRGRLYDYLLPHHGLGFTYPPFAAVLLRPITRLPESAGQQLWLVAIGVSAVAFFALCCAVATDLPARRLTIPLVIGVGIWMMPVRLTANLGQINGLVAVAVIIDALLLKRRSRAAGLGVGFATAIKLTPAIMIGWYFISGRRRTAGTATGGFLAATLLGVAFYPSASYKYWTAIVFDTRRVGATNSFFSSAIRRYIAWLPLPPSAQDVIWAACAVLVIAIAYRRATAADRAGHALYAFAVVMCASYLVSPITWGHHLWFAVAAIIAIIGDGRSWRRNTAAILALLLLADPWEQGLGRHTSVLETLLLLAIVLAPLGRGRARGRRQSAVRRYAAPARLQADRYDPCG